MCGRYACEGETDVSAASACSWVSTKESSFCTLCLRNQPSAPRLNDFPASISVQLTSPVIRFRFLIGTRGLPRLFLRELASKAIARLRQLASEAIARLRELASEAIVYKLERLPPEMTAWTCQRHPLVVLVSFLLHLVAIVQPIGEFVSPHRCSFSPK